MPSQTELLYDLGLQNEVMGITKFCVHPSEWFRTKERIGGTKTLNIEKIKALQPDLIIANKEENVREQIEELAKHFPVWVSDVNTLADALQMIERIGQLTDKAKEAKIILQRIREGFTQLKTGSPKPRTAYLIWREPYMTVGGDTFINDMLNKANFENVFAAKTRYPVISVEDLQRENCQLLLLSSEPYPFQQKHIQELQQHLPSTRISLVDGELFSWYGSRLLQAPAYFQCLHVQFASNLKGDVAI